MYSNLCGEVATYNNSFCIGSAGKVEIFNIYIVFSYNSANHNVGMYRYYSDGSFVCEMAHSLVFSDSGISYYGSKSSNMLEMAVPYQVSPSDVGSLINDIHFGPDSWYGVSTHSLQIVEVMGVQFIKSGTSLTLKPIIGTSVHQNSGNPYLSLCNDSHQTTSYTLPTVTASNNGSLITSTNSIDLSKLGANYTKVNGKNNNLPILKDYYWEYS